MISLLKLFHENNRESGITDFDLFQNLCTCHFIEIKQNNSNNNNNNNDNNSNNNNNDNNDNNNCNLANFFSNNKTEENEINFNQLYINTEMEKESNFIRNSIIIGCVGCLSSVVKKLSNSVLPHPLITKLNPSFFLEKEIEKIDFEDLNFRNDVEIGENFNKNYYKKDTVKLENINSMAHSLFSNFVSLVNQSTNKCINRYDISLQIIISHFVFFLPFFLSYLFTILIFVKLPYFFLS